MERIARRLQGLVQSDIRRMTRECERLGGINLGQGICDVPLAAAVRRAGHDAIDERSHIYSFPEGVLPLRQAISKKLERDNGLSADPLKNIVVTVGATGAFACSVTALLDPGDGIVIFEPYYGYHLNTALIAGLEPQLVTLTPPSFAITEAALRAALKPNSRAIVLCTPSNPSGKMLTRPELDIVAKVAKERDLVVITDEIYEYFRFDGRTHISPATHPDLRDRSVSIMGMSKTFSMTGWRLGYAVTNETWARAINLVNDLHYVCAPTPLQKAVVAGFALGPEFYRDLVATYQKKRDLLCGTLKKVGLTPIVPEGAYYVLADVSRLGYPNAKAAAMGLLEKVGVASVPGSAFYTGPVGDSLVRFCFAKEDDQIEEACKRLAKLG